MRRAFALLVALLIAGTLVAGCGSAGTGSACSNLGADTKGIYGYVKKQREHGSLSSSEQQALSDLQAEAREAYAACQREGRVKTLPHPSPP
jgi:hypothetical protein